MVLKVSAECHTCSRMSILGGVWWQVLLPRSCLQDSVLMDAFHLGSTVQPINLYPCAVLLCGRVLWAPGLQLPAEAVSCLPPAGCD